MVVPMQNRTSAELRLTAEVRNEIGQAVSGAPSLPPSVAPNSELPGTIISIQVLRFLAAFIVVLFHARVALVRNFPQHVQHKIDQAFGVGASGVHIFFVISGFVMVYTSIRSELTPRSFLQRRLIRIYPIYWVLLALYLISHYLLGTPYTLSLIGILNASFLLPSYSSLIIGPGWTLSFEMYFYLCFTVALLFGAGRGLFFLTGFYFLSVLAGWSLRLSNTFTDSLLLEFVAGAWLGLAYSRGFRLGHKTGSAFILLGIALFACGFRLDYHRVPSVISWGVPSLFLVSGSLALERDLNSATARFFARLGDSSYFLYLSHVLVIDLLLATPISRLNRDLSSSVVLTFPLALACTALAAGGYKLVELPLLNAMKRLMIGKRMPNSRERSWTSPKP